MVQTLCSYKILAGKKRIMLEKPHVLSRVFFSILKISEQASWSGTKISFDDPLFRSFFVMDGWSNYFKAEGVDIFHGDVWIYNASTVDYWYSETEILH